MSNSFTQLNAANGGGDYLTLKKSKNIYNIDNTKTKINTKVIVKGNKHNKNSFNYRLLFSKGLLKNDVCTVKNTTNFTSFPYERTKDQNINF